MTICPAPRIWFKGHASAWLFSFSRNFFFFSPASMRSAKPKKEKFSLRVCTYARGDEINNSLELYFLL